MAKANSYGNDTSIASTDKLFGTDTDGTTKNYKIENLTTYLSGQISIDQGEMATAVYDPAEIEEQLVGLTATQTLTNKTINFSTGGTNTLVADASDILYNNTISSLTATNTKTAIDELASVSGWAIYSDSTYTSDSPLVLDKAEANFPVNGLGSATNKEYLPTGVTDLWNVGTNKIIVDAVGDSYLCRLDFKAISATANAYAVISFDVGSGSPNIIASETVTFPKGDGEIHVFSTTISLFALGAFVTNGCKITISTVDGDHNISFYDFGIFIQRVSKG